MEMVYLTRMNMAINLALNVERVICVFARKHIILMPQQMSKPMRKMLGFGCVFSFESLKDSQ
jgi:hypothetical protein